MNGTSEQLSCREMIDQIITHIGYLKSQGLTGLVPQSLKERPVTGPVTGPVRSQVADVTGTVLTSAGDTGDEADAGDTADAAAALDAIRLELGDCRRCPLHRGRRNIVFGEGNPQPEIVLVGEGPGFDEDRSGRPFVGRAGHLLDRIIAAMGLRREEIYICNVVKCRPPENRDPEMDEIDTCTRFLNAQIEILNPRIIVALGRISGRYLTGQGSGSIRSMRGVFHQFRGKEVRVTYHPAALLRNQEYRRPVWEDVQAVMARLGRPIGG
ncbi:MAG TPA: uracil-DNA glycosylase, partial [bacterium]|nr:uracil-DNA glycosylase [bacterium]